MSVHTCHAPLACICCGYDNPDDLELRSVDTVENQQPVCHGCYDKWIEACGYVVGH